MPPGRALWVVLEPLLDRFVSHHEPKPSRCLRFSCPLHIEVPERHGVRHGLRSTFFHRDEVELIVDAPVVRHGVRRAVLEHQLRVALRGAADKHVRWQWRDEIRDRIRDRVRDWIRDWNEDAVSTECRRTRREPPHANHSYPWSCQWPPRGARLREGRSTRNEQSENRATNRTAHVSPPARSIHYCDYTPPVERHQPSNSDCHVESKRGIIAAMKTAIPQGLIVILIVLGALENMQAVTPAPDGGYGPPAYGTGNTAEGENALLSLTTGVFNTATGYLSLQSNTTGRFNTAIGAGALLNNTANQNTATGAGALLNNITGAFNTANGEAALFFNTTGTQNTATGTSALQSNTTGNFNTADGVDALITNTTGSFNTANGVYALRGNTTGTQNTATGVNALVTNTTGSFNTANGVGALQVNSTGDSNTANGVEALRSNTDGFNNTALGVNALRSNTDGGHNTATGAGALLSNTTGNLNTATGEGALNKNTTGSGGTAIGWDALFDNTSGNGNTAIGSDALTSNTTGRNNTVVGSNAGISLTTASNVICIGANVAGANLSNSCYIGSIFNQSSSAGAAVFINSSGKLGTLTSSRRFKHDIKPMDKASEALFALKPVSFQYKKEIDPVGTSQLGLVAEDVEKVNPDLVVHDKEGKPYSVRYDQVNAMLLNEFLKEHRAFLKEQRKVQELEANAVHQQKQIEALTAGLQKVSAQLEANKPALQLATSNEYDARFEKSSCPRP